MSEFDVETVELSEGIEGWKEEVKRLLDQIHYLKTENAASQLISALVLKHHGEVTVDKQEIADGLPGHEIQINEPEAGKITFSLKYPDEDDTPDASVLHEQ